MSRLIKIPLVTFQTPLQNCRFLGTSLSTNSNPKRERLVILGTGWGSFATLKNACKKKYDITVVSPRNYFLFTPMLPMVTVGTVDSRSIIDPIRDGYKFRDSNDYQCAYVTNIDTKKRELTCKSALDMKDDYDPTPFYTLNYDKLVIGVGAVTNTFNVPGVYEHAYFLKDVDHAHNIRRKFAINLEKACQPNISEQERRRLLQIVVVGGGPTGVEYSGMVYDFMTKDLKNKYNEIEKYVKAG